MKITFKKAASGFTLIELLVVIAIMGILMSLGANVLHDPGRSKNVTAGVQVLQNMIQEARATAIGNDTCARVIVACDEADDSPDSIHLRYMTVQKYKRDENENKEYDGTDTERVGEWVSTSSGTFLPGDVFFSPTYSTQLQWEGGADVPLEQTRTRLAGYGEADVYYIEFDEKGRFVTPDTKPGEPARARRLVLMCGSRDNGSGSVDGILPSDTDPENDNRPTEVSGLVLWPSGNISPMKTVEQVYDEELFKTPGASRKKSSAKKNKQQKKGGKAKDKAKSGKNKDKNKK